MSRRSWYLDYVKALTRHFDDPVIGGADRMGRHQLMALEEVRPDLHRLAVAEFGPFANDHAHPELEQWIGEHWRDEGCG